MKKTGILYGIGVGPGDPELLTLKGLRLIQSCPVLAWPAPLEGDSMARSIVKPHLSGQHLEIPIQLPMTPAHFPALDIYEDAAKRIADHLNAGRDVAVLCEGDPLFYGSFTYLFDMLSPEFETHIVPGISSLNGAAAQFQVPLARGQDVLSILPAPLADHILEARLSACEGAVIIKLGRHFKRIYALLGRLGLLEHARYIAHATMEQQKIFPLARMSPDQAPYFSIIHVQRKQLP